MVNTVKSLVENLVDRYSIQMLLNKGYKIQDENGNRIEKLQNLSVDYSSIEKDHECLNDNLIDFWIINKNIAEEIIGNEITDDVYEYECCNNVSHITNYAHQMSIFEKGILCGGHLNFLSKESIEQVILHMQKILNNYDEYFESFMNEQLNVFVSNCIDVSKKYKEKKQKSKKEIKRNPEINLNQNGIIYIMKNCGYYKIGKAKIGSSRFGEYTKLPEEPEYIIKTIVHSYGKVEIALQERYKEKRLRDGGCEWFDLTDEDINNIKSFVKKYEVKDKI